MSRMIAARILLAMLVIGLSQCLAHAEGLTNQSTNPAARRVGDYTVVWTNHIVTYVNPAEFWSGVWKEGANGWRVHLRIYSQTNWWFDGKGNRDPLSSDLTLRVEWGSNAKNSGSGYFMTPNGKFARFQLLDAKRNVLPPNPSAGLYLLERRVMGTDLKLSPEGKVIFHKTRLRYGTHLPAWVSPENGSLETKFPEVISTNVYPFYHNGSMAGGIESFTNRPPPYVALLNLDQIYSVTNEGDYTLLVQPVLYKQNPTNQAVLDRVDLPSVATKVHLVPKAK